MRYGPFLSPKMQVRGAKEAQAKTPNNQWRLANALMAIQDDDEGSVKRLLCQWGM